MDQPLVSVIITTYNRETYLEQALESVAKQTYPNIEMVVVDDGSQIRYAEPICGSYTNCHYHYKENGGVSSARNFGVAQASGSFIAFLDDDDLWKEDKIEKQVQLLLDHPGIDLIHSAAVVVNQNNEPTGDIIGASISKAHKRSGYVFWNALAVWTVKASTPLIRKSIFRDTFFFDERLKAGEDSDFYQRVFYKHKIRYMEEPTTFYRVYESDQRLSMQGHLYEGVEPIMFENFKRMNISNPLVMYKIARRILRLAMRNWNQRNPKKSLKISKFDLLFRPWRCLEKFER